MATDNVVSNPGTGGSTFRTFNDATAVEWPASVVCYVSGGSANNWTLQQVDATHGLPITATTLPLPTGAATSAKQPALGTAGTASADVITVQGIASMTPLKVDGSGVTQPISGTVTVVDSVPLPVVLTAASVIAGEFKLVDSAGANLAAVSAAGALKVDGSAATQPISGTVTANQGGAPWTANITQIAGSALALGQAAMAASIPVVIANNQTAFPVSQSGTWTVGLSANQQITPVAGTSGGATPYHLVSAASTNATSVKGSAGTVYSVQAFNVNASPRYLKFFDKASAPVIGTDTPVKVIMLPGNASGAGAVVNVPVGVAFSSGIAIAIVGGIADTDATAIGAADCVINFDYK